MVLLEGMEDGQFAEGLGGEGPGFGRERGLELAEEGGHAQGLAGKFFVGYDAGFHDFPERGHFRDVFVQEEVPGLIVEPWFIGGHGGGLVGLGFRGAFSLWEEWE
jgi:hypothetical protein